MTDEPPPPPEGLPESVVRVLERSLVLDVDSRFPTAAAMQRALEAAMNEMGEATTSEDVAAFLRSELPELAQRRKDVVQRAVDEARDRVAPSGETHIIEGDVAFAPTVMSERQASPSTRREGRVALPGDAPAAAPDPLDHEPIRIPKTSRAWLWITLVLLGGGGAAAYRWPAEVRAVLARIGIGVADDAGGQVVPAASGTTSAASTASVPAVERPPSSSAAAPLAASTPEPPPTAAPGAVLPASATSSPAGAPPRPEPGSTHHTWPTGRDPATPASAAIPSASAPVAASAWSPYKPAPSPAESEGPSVAPAPP